MGKAQIGQLTQSTMQLKCDHGVRAGYSRDRVGKHQLQTRKHMTQQLSKIISVYNKNNPNRQHTYLAPKTSFDTFIRDELMWVTEVNEGKVTAFRTMTGKFYEINADNAHKFRLISS